MSIVVTLIILGIIIMIHEWGHYYAAVKCGILVEEFAMGMGPKLFSFKKGDTVFSLRLFPIGGFCKMMGEDEDHSDPRAFNNKSVTRRIIVIVAGALMNFVLALVLFIALTGIKPLSLPIVGEVIKGTPAESVGLMPNDVIKKVNSARINTIDDFHFEMSEYKTGSVKIVVERNGERFEKDITPVKSEDGRNTIGMQPMIKMPLFSDVPAGTPKVDIFDLFVHGFWQLLFWIKTSLIMVFRLLTFNVNFSEISGLIGMGAVVDKTLDASIGGGAVTPAGIMLAVQNMINLTGIICTNVGVLNLLPLPALDGGRIFFLTVEGIRRKPIPTSIEGRIHLVGFALLIVLAVCVAYFDITKLFNL